MDKIQQVVIDTFTDHFGEAPALLVRAPGRVNLIGEHTDYNDGFVLPLAINRTVWIALRPREDDRVRVYLMDFQQEVDFSLDQLEKGPSNPLEYIKGMAWALESAGLNLKAWEGVLKSDVPIGAGLSSSAALEMATARAFHAVSGFVWNKAQIAKLGQKTENQWIGVKSGIMDQMISVSGQAGYALLIDCRSLETELVPLPTDTAVVILDTSTRRGLVGGAYNERRAQCEEAARFFRVKALRDVNLDQLEAHMDQLEPLTRRRARHVVSENERTLAARDAMKANDPSKLGRLMNDSHDSLRDDFEVSTDALNAIVECARGHWACYGARMTGAGFGGCAVALVKANGATDFAQQVAECYRTATGHTAQIYITSAAEGASTV
ncbi:MAG: galactokinase [Anaerolineae bacterium]|jgi:galactokinase|nr:galactokinase [Anaerolineae bacterium]